MKTSNFLLLTGIVLLMSFNTPPAGISDAERKKAVDLLQQSKDKLMKDLKGLSADQLNFKPSPDNWSIAECVEHLAVTENGLFGMYQTSMKAAADPSMRSQVKMSDDEVLNMISSRSTKVKTRPELVPTNRFGSYDASLKEFTKLRDEHIKYLKSATDDMHNHYGDMPFGKMDAYQIILFLGGHSQRHTGQIEEVMANANFPKK